MCFVVFFQKFRQLTQSSLLAPLFLDFLGRHAKDGFARLNVLVDSRSGQHDRTRANDQVLVDANTAPKNYIVLDACHTSDGGMCPDEAVVANITVVPNLAVVVELGATLDEGI